MFHEDQGQQTIAQSDRVNNQPSVAFTIEGTAKMTSLSRGSIYAAMNTGSLQARKWGDRTIILRSDLLQWLEALPPYKTAA